MVSTAPLSPGGKLPMLVHVTAPASLQAGYTFEAEIHGDPDKIITVQVPEGGVEEGQMFLAPLPESYEGDRVKAPTGRWKDGLFDCFSVGICHPSLWCSLCCTQLAMGQAIRRMQLTWLGEPGPISKTQQAFAVICMLVGSYFVYSTALQLASLDYEQGAEPAYIPALKFVGHFLFTVWAVYALCRTRETVRARYQIPERMPRQLVGCEDLCCSLFCSCCVAAQILRHTGEYETYPGLCCSPSGHAPGTPLAV